MHHQQQLQQNNKNLLNAPAKEEFLNFSCLFFFPPKDVIENEVSGRAVKKKKERKERQEEGNFSMEKIASNVIIQF